MLTFCVKNQVDPAIEQGVIAYERNLNSDWLTNIFNTPIQRENLSLLSVHLHVKNQNDPFANSGDNADQRIAETD